jgi:hypothetical protein
MTLETFLAEAERLRAAARPGPPKYPNEMKDFAVGYARSSGKTASHAAKALRLSSATLNGWLHARKRRLRPVTVVEDAGPGVPGGEAGGTSNPEGALTLTTAQGHRVDGLSMEQAIALLRGLQ